MLAKTAALELHRSKQLPGESSGIEGLQHFDQVVRVDQSPIGKVRDQTGYFRKTL